MTVRVMENSDLKNVRTLWEEVGFELSTSDSIEELKRMLSHNPNLCFVLENENKSIIGAVLGGFDGRRGWVHHLAIKKEYRRRGNGQELMDKIVSTFEDMNIIKIKLEILESNREVILFYKNLGWMLRSELTTMSLDLPRK